MIPSPSRKYQTHVRILKHHIFMLSEYLSTGHIDDYELARAIKTTQLQIANLESQMRKYVNRQTNTFIASGSNQ